MWSTERPIGVVGKDVFWKRADVSELSIRVLAAASWSWPSQAGITGRISSYNSRGPPSIPISRDYFPPGLQVEVIKLSGSIELGPTGLAEPSWTLMKRGTLLANDLEPIAQVAAISARLIVNPIRYRVKLARIQSLVDALSGALERKGV